MLGCAGQGGYKPDKDRIQSADPYFRSKTGDAARCGARPCCVIFFVLIQMTREMWRDYENQECDDDYKVDDDTQILINREEPGASGPRQKENAANGYEARDQRVARHDICPEQRRFALLGFCCSHACDGCQNWKESPREKGAINCDM